jgi:hypothetical protein
MHHGGGWLVSNLYGWLGAKKGYVRFSNGPVLGCPVLARMNHSGTGQVRFWDGHCIFRGLAGQTQDKKVGGTMTDMQR